MGTACEGKWQDCAENMLRRRLQVVSIDLDRHALHDHIQRKHNPKVAFLADQHAFHPGHRSGLDTDPLTDDKIRMGLDFPLSDTRAQCLDFKIGKRRQSSSKTNQRQHTRHFEHADAVAGIDMHKTIIWKKWQIEVYLAPVLPAMEG